MYHFIRAAAGGRAGNSAIAIGGTGAIEDAPASSFTD
jgi:hypothetical protein